jgi:hypothetical protein
MLSLPMNEFLQQSFKEIGIDIDFKVVELETLYTHWRKGAADEMNAGITANNIAYVTSDPLYAIVRFFHSGQIAPVGVNWGGYKNPKVDALIDEAKQTFDPAKQDELLAQAHALIVDDAALVWVVHDTNPHALSPKVKKFVQAQHWFQDLTTIGLELLCATTRANSFVIKSRGWTPAKPAFARATARRYFVSSAKRRSSLPAAGFLVAADARLIEIVEQLQRVASSVRGRARSPPARRPSRGCDSRPASRWSGCAGAGSGRNARCPRGRRWHRSPPAPSCP